MQASMFQKLEPYVVYEGFSMGSQPSSSGMSEIQDAIWNNEKVIIIIDDSNFASRVTDYLTIGRSCLAEGEDETMMQRACFLCSSSSPSQLICSLPKKFSHPALMFIQESFVSSINYSIAPSLVKTQLDRWGLAHSRITAFTRLALERKVDTGLSSVDSSFSVATASVART